MCSSFVMFNVLEELQGHITDIGETVIEPEEEKASSTKPRRFDRLWDRIIEMIYDTFDDFTVEPKQDDQPEIIEPLNMKM